MNSNVPPAIFISREWQKLQQTGSAVMNSKKVNLAFLVSVIIYVGGVFAISAFCPYILENVVLNNLICESMMVLPGFVVFLFSEKEKAEFLSFHRIKTGTLLAVIPFTLFSMPLISLANLLSQFFTTNRVIEAMETTDMGSDRVSGHYSFLQVFLPHFVKSFSAVVFITGAIGNQEVPSRPCCCQHCCLP